MSTNYSVIVLGLLTIPDLLEIFDIPVFELFVNVKYFILLLSHERPHLVYFAAMIQDSLLRFSWVFKYLMKTYTKIDGGVIGLIFSFLEIFRRFIWNFFRLENEHLNNCGEFRAIRDISIAPLR